MLLALGLSLFTTQLAGQAQLPDALRYSRGYLVTGNYVVGGVDFPPGGGSGRILIGSDTRNAVPADSDVVAAYLYWEDLTPRTQKVAPAYFRGQLIASAKASRLVSPPGGASCFGAVGSNVRNLTMLRADVLALLPKQYDANNQWTGRYLANGAHDVSMGTPGGGNTLATVAGASLVIVYRNLGEPLRKIAFYDGVHAMAEGAMMSQTLRGFYGAENDASARLTHIVGNGGNNRSETVSFNGVAVSATDPFPNPKNSADRGWANPTFNVGSLLSRNATNTPYGETATTTVTYGSTQPNECASWAGVIFSTAVTDGDRDGLPDALEGAEGGLKDPPTPRYPDGVPLPNLFAMGARVSQKDLFVEINAMTAAAGTTYGSGTAPFRTNITDVTDNAGHDHMPNPAVLKMVGDAYKGGGIAVHFDVGDPAVYLRAFGDPDTNPSPAFPCDVDDCKGAGEYLIKVDAGARGGERISERDCEDCQFEDFPGTLGWPYGFQVYGDAPVSADGKELLTPAQLTDATNRERFASFIRNWGDERRRRFDRNRDDYFRYAIFAHARGKAKSPLPCLDDQGEPTMSGFQFNPATKKMACTGHSNPAFHVPTSASGMAQLPGNALLISLGLWDTEHFVGSTFVQASTLMHELGHTLNLWHGGKPATFGNAIEPTRVEPNCKSNYFSVMSYLFQVHGLFDAGGVPRIDYSGVAGDTIREHSVSDGTQLGSGAGQFNFTYRPAWFVPVGSTLFAERGATPARRYCNGAADPPPNAWARIQALTTDEPIQWDGEPGSGQYFTGPRDVNFDGVDDQVLDGYDDWTNLRLDQIGAGRRVQIVSNANGDLLDFASGDLLDFASGDLLDFASGDLLDFASGTQLLDMNSGAYIRYDAGDLLDFASGDLLDFASGDLLDFASGSLMTSGDGDLLDFASGDLLDFASGDLLDFASGDLIDFGSGDLLDFASGDLLDFGSGDLLDFASGDLIDFGSGTGQEEMTFELAIAMERPRPHGVTVCVLGVDCADAVAAGAENYHRAKLSWRAPTFGEVQNYQVYRYYSTENPSGFIDFATVPQNQFVYIGSTADGQTREFIDQEELPAGVRFAYYVRALLTDDTLSNNSDLALNGVNRYIIATNDTPVAANDSGAEVVEGDAVAIAVLANDTDTDSLPGASSTRLIPGAGTSDTFAARAGLRVVITQEPGDGTAVVNSDGTVTYTPDQDYAGEPTDTFTYKVNNGTWNNMPLSADSDEVTVTVTVRSRHTATVVTISPASPTYGDSITLQANVTPHSNLGDLDPASTVTFREGDTILANVPLQDGAFIFSTSSLTAGSHTITAEFCGGPTHPHDRCGQYYGSSGSATFTIARATSSTVVSCPASVTYTGAPRTPCSAMTTGAGGLSQSTTVTYSNNTNIGTATANATYAGDANHTGSSGSATFAIDVYRFVNVQNMPAPAGKSFASISTIPLQWQWATATGEVLNTRSVVPRMMAYACSNLEQKLPGGYPVGEFSSLNPGLGNSFSYSETTNTWQFNWKLHYRAADRKYYGLPTGNYVIAVVDQAMSTFRYPATTNTCDGGLQIVGALVVVK